MGGEFCRTVGGRIKYRRSWHTLPPSLQLGRSLVGGHGGSCGRGVAGLV